MAMLRYAALLLVLGLCVDFGMAEESKKPETATTTAAPETTEAPSLEVGTSTPMPSSASGILDSIGEIIFKQLHSSRYQWVVALVAAIFGLVMVFDGDFFFKWLIVCAVFLVTGIMAMDQVSKSWDLDDDSAIRNIVGLEAGAIGGYAALRGIEGMQLLFGAMVGCTLAQQTAALLLLHGVQVLETHKIILFLYTSAFVVGFVLLFRKKAYQRFLAILMPGLGGALVASSVAWAFTTLAVNGKLNFLNNMFKDLSPNGGTWVQFFSFIWMDNSEDFGIFANSPHNLHFKGSVYRTDRIADCTLWFVVFLIGAVIQLKRHKESIVAAREQGSLTESLLEQGKP
eukprot:TRINITY_DN29961_c0_g1_i1.p1 TRINITY_DN29961_c0_g1~~TRINITY_DN29961_c0_g1_i1.p1  ORF type:complete len:342 (-),score=75.08 TRINITY_DN29961_c0_g1_i1:56-1081(-)